jgi:hypothetical protein
VFGAATSNVNPRNGADLHFFMFGLRGSTRRASQNELTKSAVFLLGPHELEDVLLQPNERRAGALFRLIVCYRVSVRDLSSPTRGRTGCSTETSGFSLALEEGEVVTLSDGSLDVSNESSVLSANEFDLDLSDTTTRAYEQK